MDDVANLTLAYREARRDFIAACQSAGANIVSRVHPARGPDGRPLFCDSAAFGPRDAPRGLLLIAGADDRMTSFLGHGFAGPKRARVVVVHALDPFAWAWSRSGDPADWPQRTLCAIAAEDLSRVKKLTVLDLGKKGGGNSVEAALAEALPKTATVFQTLAPHEAGPAIRAAMDGL